jgi:hypothetical protein
MDTSLRAPLQLLSCEAARPLAAAVAGHLGVPLAASEDQWFASGEGKHVKVTTLNGDIVEFKNVPTGILMVQARRVWADTSASDILALW